MGELELFTAALGLTWPRRVKVEFVPILHIHIEHEQGACKTIEITGSVLGATLISFSTEHFFMLESG